MKMTESELKIVLEKHALWVRNDPNGVRANLCEADLHNADFHGANLCGAKLSRADLRHADLRHADLCWAYLCGAKLYRADLRNADFHGANFRDADLSRADLRAAKNLNCPLTCPEKGSFIGFKKVRGDYIVELEILADALRSSATGRKCRCSKAKVISITNPDGSNAGVAYAVSGWDSEFIYSIGEIVEVKNFDTNRWDECTTGIHFFITRQEAIDYVL